MTSITPDAIDSLAYGRNALEKSRPAIIDERGSSACHWSWGTRKVSGIQFSCPHLFSDFFFHWQPVDDGSYLFIMRLNVGH
jgi:hypothetical protein